MLWNETAARRALPRNAPARRLYLCTLACGLLTLPLMPVGARAQNAKTVLEKMRTLYGKATSLELQKNATQTVAQGGKTSVLTTREQIKFKAPNKIYISALVSATGALAKQVGNGTITTVSNGRTLWGYNSREKKYMKQALPAAMRPVSPLTLLRMPLAEASSVKMLPASTVQGRPAYVIEMFAALPNDPRITPEQRQQYIKMRKPWRLYIDKQNYHLLRVLQADGSKILGDAVLSKQKINGAIADSAFNFTPPPGTALVTQPAGGAPQPKGAQR